MSINFSTVQPIIGFRSECGCGASVSAMFAEYEEAKAHTAGGFSGCGDEDCAVYPAYTVGVYVDDEAPMVNMSNVNATDVLLSLGRYDEGEMCGTMSGAEMLAAVTIALKDVPANTGRDTLVEGNAVFCGRGETYVQSRLDDIRAIAIYAAERGYEISWG